MRREKSESGNSCLMREILHAFASCGTKLPHEGLERSKSNGNRIALATARRKGWSEEEREQQRQREGEGEEELILLNGWLPSAMNE